MLFDRAAKKLTQVARSRPDIKPDEVGEVITIEYKARDGLTIPALDHLACRRCQRTSARTCR